MYYIFIGNIICVSAQLRDEVLSHNFLSRLINFVDAPIPIEYKSRIMWIIANIGPRSNVKPPVAQKVLVELLPILNKMIALNDVGVIINNR